MEKHINNEIDDTFHEARQLHEQVDEHLRGGQMDRAKRVFSQGWRDAVPELPFRFHPILQRPDREAVLELRSRLGAGGRVPELRLRFVGGRRDPDAVEVWTVGRGRVRLGDLPAKDVRFLRDIGRDADLYTPSLLEIQVTSDLRLGYVAIELAREELHFCPSCGVQHDGLRAVCDRCRRRRRRDTRDGKRVDATPIAFHEVVEAIAEHGSDDDSDPLS